MFFNKNFSLKSIYNQSEWQKKSSGSWVPSLDYDITFLTDKINNRKSKNTQYNIGANIGYFYSWVIGEKVNISPHLVLGFGGKFSKYYDTLEDGSRMNKENKQFLTVKFGTGIHIGYNSDRFLLGGKINFDGYSYDEAKNYTVENNTLFGLIYIGYRFPPPKAIKENYEKLQKKMPIL